jgi:hypothetical protein
MILPARGTPVERERRASVREQLKGPVIQRKIKQLMSVDKIRLASVFGDAEVHRLCDEMNVRFRVRNFTPAAVLGLFVSQTLNRDEACSAVMARFNRERKRQGRPAVREDASAYCKARAKLPVELIDRLSDQIAKRAHEGTLESWKWKGKNVYLVDGLVLRAPDTAANQAVYPQPATQQEGLGYPQVRVLLTTSLATGIVLHYNTSKVEGKRTGEATLFREKHGDFAAGDVVVGDSNFESFHDAVLLNRCGVDIVFCINGKKSPSLPRSRTGGCILPKTWPNSTASAGMWNWISAH